MSDEFPDISSRLPSMEAALASRISARQGTSATLPPGVYDPYQAILDRKNGKTPEPVVPESVKWPEEDVQRLEDYCKKVGVVGFNCGKMHPIAALAMLKRQVGDFSNTPLEERVPEGYQKLGTRVPYGDAIKKQILHG